MESSRIGNNDLLIASNNQGKISEIKVLLAPYFCNIYSLKDLDIKVDPQETGKTFFENALIKAEQIHKISKYPVLADDSGLIVDALGGEPGVFSARYSGQNATDEQNNQKLLTKMQGVADRRAHFFCSAILYFSATDYIVGEGKTEGEILLEPLGDSGFGYDPLFFSLELGKSFGLACAQQKNKISHRARALADIVKKLQAKAR